MTVENGGKSQIKIQEECGIGDEILQALRDYEEIEKEIVKERNPNDYYKEIID